MTAIPPGRPVIFGEVLFDRFPDGSAVLGGAPFNVAWHLHGFGLEPLFISRIGDNAPGQQILDTLHAWGMDTTGVQIDPARPTGTVTVALEEGQPTFSILPNQAYDFVDLTAAAAALAGGAFSLLYHGTLVMRTAASRAVLERLRSTTELPVFVDLNLRAPWWDREAVQQSLSGARWGKLNDGELALVLGRGLDAAGLEQGGRDLCDRFGLELVVVTRGAQGALIVSEHEAIHAEPVRVNRLVDTVGAGDAFSAVTILGLVKAWPLAVTLHRAAAFAAAVCGMRGATTADRALYATTLSQWRRETGGL